MGEEHNFLVPVHTKLSKEEISKLLEDYSLDSVFKLPKIKLKDPALKEFEELEVGDIIKIVRESFAGKVPYYRLVVE